MASQQIKLNHGQKSCVIESKEYDKLYVLKDYLSQVFKLAKFKLYYKEKDTEVYIESEKQYMDMVNSGDVRELFLVEDNQKDKNYFDFFMQQLFVNNVCCENDQSGCVICQEKKQVKPEEFNQLVKECLHELIDKEDFQAFCKKQFKRNIQDIDLFLEQFSKLSKPIKSIIAIQPSQQQQLQIQQNQQVSAIRQTNTPVQSQFYKQNIMNKSTNIHRQSEVQQQIPKSQLMHPGSSYIRSSIIAGHLPEFCVKYEKREEKIQEFNADTYAKIDIFIINNGLKRWPESVYIKQVGHYPQNIQYLPQLNPGEKRSLSLQFQSPINAGAYTYTWVMFYKDENDQERRIGSKCVTEFKIKDLSRERKAQKCVEMISKSLFSDTPKKEIRNKVDDYMQKNPEMGIQQIVNMVKEELEL
ncbi:unnamed protein product (macronuclear) [Paramecium tetraurelia]|uniref:Next to BRCA1 central domain-containing protein n=1 Tax=Paramecium tetraurelia TaxID=5888 RepID=A0BH64_PARTE|nr:uncharacterized protein GSPATT00028916001 [Paramecium tetraurelia]CAK57881.1 unnamed protein product [Paramecium tetraurelia]|eukprot:XP_001425279.1 hypothetical protein (macronuclear) [Paramecium tetraurelia strain d4-2]